jgi:hypothetical protein
MTKKALFLDIIFVEALGFLIKNQQNRVLHELLHFLENFQILIHTEIMNFPASNANGKKTSSKTNVAKIIALKSLIKVFILFSLETK